MCNPLAAMNNLMCQNKVTNNNNNLKFFLNLKFSYLFIFKFQNFELSNREFFEIKFLEFNLIEKID